MIILKKFKLNLEKLKKIKKKYLEERIYRYEKRKRKENFVVICFLKFLGWVKIRERDGINQMHICTIVII
jgi:hypothetical protein